MDKKLVFAMTGWATAGLMGLAYLGRGKQLKELTDNLNAHSRTYQLAERIVTEDVFKNIIKNYDM